jgi:hypothetical protein
MAAYDAEYQLYAKRFAVEVGEIAVGEYGTWGGKLIMRLGPDEFGEAYGEFRALEEQMRRMMSEGLTLSDYVNDRYREAAARVLERPEEFL